MVTTRSYENRKLYMGTNSQNYNILCSCCGNPITTDGQFDVVNFDYQEMVNFEYEGDNPPLEFTHAIQKNLFCRNRSQLLDGFMHTCEACSNGPDDKKFHFLVPTSIMLSVFRLLTRDVQVRAFSDGNELFESSLYISMRYSPIILKALKEIWKEDENSTESDTKDTSNMYYSFLYQYTKENSKYSYSRSIYAESRFRKETELRFYDHDSNVIAVKESLNFNPDEEDKIEEIIIRNNKLEETFNNVHDDVVQIKLNEIIFRLCKKLDKELGQG